MHKSSCILAAILAVVTVAGSQSLRFRSGVLLHHSTGGRIWSQPGSTTTVPGEINKYNTSHALAGTDGVSLDESLWPQDPIQNEWERWHRIFLNQDTVSADIRPILAANSIVVIKSCFPSSSITKVGSPADTLTPAAKSIYNYKWHWRSIVRAMQERHGNYFVLWTNAPLVAAATSDLRASLSNQFCRWAKDTLATGRDPVFGPFPSNVYVFDFFHKVADSGGKLLPQYAMSSTDSHPNAAATDLIAPLFVRETFDHALQYESQPNPVTLSSFCATSIGRGNEVLLQWTTLSEINNYGFYVQRRGEDDDAFLELANSFVPGNGTTVIPNAYSFTDYPPSISTWIYRLKQVDLDGTIDFSDPINAVVLTGVIESRPVEFGLRQNFPNPFNPDTEIEFSVGAETRVRLEVFTILGEWVVTLLDGYVEPGTPHKVRFHSDQRSGGIYLCRLQSGEKVAVRKMLLLK